MDILKRIGAIVLVLVLIGMYVATFIMGITGSDNLMGMIFLDVVIPVVCWEYGSSPGCSDARAKI